MGNISGIRSRKDDSEISVLLRMVSGDGGVRHDLGLCATDTMLFLRFISEITSMTAMTGFQITVKPHACLSAGLERGYDSQCSVVEPCWPEF